MQSGKDDGGDETKTRGSQCHHTRMFERVREADGRKVFRCAECGEEVDPYSSISEP
jgi:hypothetical protein